MGEPGTAKNPPDIRPYDALIVDFGGVLTTPLQDSSGGFAASLGIELQDLVLVMLPMYTGAGDDMVERFEKGTLDEAEFSRAKLLGVSKRRRAGPSNRRDSWVGYSKGRGSSPPWWTQCSSPGGPA